MSDTDSFIDEVSEEVRKEKLFATLRKYGWIGVLCVILLVGGAAWNEWRKAQERAEAEALGDAILNALERDDRASRASALSLIEAPEGAAQAVVGLLAAGERAPSDPRGAAEQLLALSEDPTVPNVYRQVAVLKAVTLPESGLDVATRRERLAALVPGGGITRLLAEEQLALLLLEEGQRNAAIDRLQLLRIDAEITASMAQRVTQLIVALGAVPNDTASPLLPPTGGDTSSEALE